MLFIIYLILFNESKTHPNNIPSQVKQTSKSDRVYFAFAESAKNLFHVIINFNY